jgi:hypothetical protein
MIVLENGILILITRFLSYENSELKKILNIFPKINKDVWKYKCIDKFLENISKNLSIKSKKFIVSNNFSAKKYYNSMIELPNNIYFPEIKNYSAIQIDRNTIYFNGNFKGGDRCVRSDICYPIFNTPFSTFYLIGQNFKLMPNLIYYYEIFIMEEDNEKWENPCISVGFGNNKFPLVGLQVGWDINSYGLHSDDGKIFHNNLSEYFTESFGENDYIGCGLFYNGKNYDIFYTKNGKFLDFAFKDIQTQNFFAVIGLDCKNKIKVNFGLQKFKFNIMKMQNLAIMNYKITNNIKKIELSNIGKYPWIFTSTSKSSDYELINLYVKENINEFTNLSENNKEKVLLNIILSLKFKLYNTYLTQSIFNVSFNRFLYSPVILNSTNFEEESIMNDSDEDEIL